MIYDLSITTDAAGFPIIAWREDRNMHSPEALRRARIECRIMKHAKTGALLFVARGSTRYGPFEEAKPWSHLRGFTVQSAQNLYYPRAWLDAQNSLTSKSVGARIVLTDAAQVITAEFADDTPIHINCADATPVEIDSVHKALLREFETNKDVLGRRYDYQWPTDDDSVVTYDPAIHASPGHSKTAVLIDALLWVAPVALIAGIAAALAWKLGVFN